MSQINKAGYMAIEVARGWALGKGNDKCNQAFGQEKQCKNRP